MSLSSELLDEFGLFYFEGDLVATPGSEGGDLASSQLDLVANDWATNLNISLIRRLNTPLGSIASSIKDVTGLMTINGDYGNPAFHMLSEPLNASTIASVREGVNSCLLQEDRIQLMSIGTRIDGTGQVPFLVLDINYIIAGTTKQDSVSVIANRTLGVFVGTN